MGFVLCFWRFNVNGNYLFALQVDIYMYVIGILLTNPFFMGSLCLQLWGSCLMLTVSYLSLKRFIRTPAACPIRVLKLVVYLEHVYVPPPTLQICCIIKWLQKYGHPLVLSVYIQYHRYVQRLNSLLDLILCSTVCIWCIWTRMRPRCWKGPYEEVRRYIVILQNFTGGAHFSCLLLAELSCIKKH